MPGILSAIDISSQGLSVQRAKMNTAAENIANAETVETKEGGPYRRKRVLVDEDEIKVNFSSMVKEAGLRLARTDGRHLGGNVHRRGEQTEVSTVNASEVVDPESGVRVVYDPSHPKANEEGYVEMPDIEIVNEMVDMMAASRGYEANTVAIAAAKKMAEDALDI